MLKNHARKEVWDLNEEDVLNFLIFKDVDSSGRTVVHHHDCPNLGSQEISSCKDGVRCGKRHAAESLRVGIFDKLRSGFDSLGRKGTWDQESLTGNPVHSCMVKEYLSFIRQEQGQSGVIPKGAKIMYKPKMDSFMNNMRLWILTLSGIPKLKARLRRALYAFGHAGIKRGAGAGHMIAPNVKRFPNNGGFAFNATWDKTLRFSSHCFGFRCEKDNESWCAHCIIDEWVSEAKKIGFSFDKGLLFPKLDRDGARTLGRWTSKDLNPLLKADLKRWKLFDGETFHSLRHGGTVTALKKGTSLKNTMYLAYMKDINTAKHYSKGLQVLFPSGFKWPEETLIKVSGNKSPQQSSRIADVDENELIREIASWKAFRNDGEGL